MEDRFFEEPSVESARSLALRPARTSDPIAAALERLTAKAVEASGGGTCTIGWNLDQESGAVHYPESEVSLESAKALVALADRQIARASDPHTPARLPSSQLTISIGDRQSYLAGSEGLAVSSMRAGVRVVVILISSASRTLEERSAILELTSEAAHAVLTGSSIQRSRDFWRTQASDVGERLAAKTAALDALVTEWTDLQSTIKACTKLRSRHRLAGMAAILARQAAFSGWIAATEQEGRLRITAASIALAPLPRLDPENALAECVASQVSKLHVVDSMRDGALTALFPEARVFLCVPFPCGAFAFASREAISALTIGRIEQTVAWLNPLLEKWAAEAELEQMRKLVRSLALRMFTAVDAERQRIARDLHDHQAQLLAGARVALAADPTEARDILKQLDNALRLRVRELRPPALGRSTLRDALRYEMRRLSDCGIKATLQMTARIKSIKRPLQQLCYQVTREAFSNIIRHADATRVEVTLRQRSDHVIVQISDNGKGLKEAAVDHEQDRATGIGLKGLRERLETMGGKLTIQRVASMTRLTATIPEF